MWTDAVEVGIACFVAMPKASDGEIRERLSSLGVEPWLASRLVTWIPVAFGRRLLREVPFRDEYLSGDDTLRLSDDPVFVAAERRAGRASRAELGAIAPRSADVDAVNKVLWTAEQRGESVDLSTLEGATALVTPLPPMEAGHGGVLEPRHVFAELVRGHGHDVVPGEGTAQRVGELELDAFVFPRLDRPSPGAQIDYVVRHPALAGGRLIESFGGFGETWHDVVSDSVRKLERGSLHVLIATLLDRTSCADQVTRETWPHPSGDYDACLGGQLLLYGAEYVDIGPLANTLSELFEREPVERAIHSIRLFTARAGEESYADEVLLDGEPWPAGEAACRAYPWPVREGYWGTRLFLMLAPA